MASWVEFSWAVRDNDNLKSHKYACITTYQQDTKSNPNPNPNPNPTSKQHAMVNIELNIVTCPTYQYKFIRDNVVAPSVPTSVVIATLPFMRRSWEPAALERTFLIKHYFTELHMRSRTGNQDKVTSRLNSYLFTAFDLSTQCSDACLAFHSDKTSRTSAAGFRFQISEWRTRERHWYCNTPQWGCQLVTERQLWREVTSHQSCRTRTSHTAVSHRPWLLLMITVTTNRDICYLSHEQPLKLPPPKWPRLCRVGR